MAINLGKSPNSELQRARFAIEAVGAGGRGLPSLLALILDGNGVEVGAGVPVHYAAPQSADGTVRLISDSRQLGTSRPSERMEVDTTAIDAEVVAIVLCLTFEAGSGTETHRAVEIIVRDEYRGSELVRRSINQPLGGSMVEFGRIERGTTGWSFSPSNRIHRGDLAVMLSRREGASPLGAAPIDVGAQYLLAAANDVAAGYCESALRGSIVTRGVAAGLPRDEAEIMLDVELDRLRVANEAALLVRLDAILHRFTDADKKLDDKERRDALQMVCRPAAGYSHGLRHDVADHRLVQFCRERGVKIKTGFLRWAVP